MWTRRVITATATTKGNQLGRAEVRRAYNANRDARFKLPPGGAPHCVRVPRVRESQDLLVHRHHVEHDSFAVLPAANRCAGGDVFREPQSPKTFAKGDVLRIRRDLCNGVDIVGRRTRAALRRSSRLGFRILFLGTKPNPKLLFRDFPLSGTALTHCIREGEQFVKASIA